MFAHTHTTTHALPGELFDHGLDSWAAILLPLTLFSALGRGDQWGANTHETFFPCLAVLAGFYLSHWEKYVTGVLYLPWVYDITQLVGQVQRSKFRGLSSKFPIAQLLRKRDLVEN